MHEIFDDNVGGKFAVEACAYGKKLARRTHQRVKVGVKLLNQRFISPVKAFTFPYGSIAFFNSFFAAYGTNPRIGVMFYQVF